MVADDNFLPASKELNLGYSLYRQFQVTRCCECSAIMKRQNKRRYFYPTSKNTNLIQFLLKQAAEIITQTPMTSNKQFNNFEAADIRLQMNAAQSLQLHHLCSLSSRQLLMHPSGLGHNNCNSGTITSINCIF